MYYLIFNYFISFPVYFISSLHAQIPSLISSFPLLRPKAKKEKALHQALETLYADLATDTPKLAAGGPADPDDKEGDDTPCVLNKFNPLATTG